MAERSESNGVFFTDATLRIDFSFRSFRGDERTVFQKNRLDFRRLSRRVRNMEILYRVSQNRRQRSSYPGAYAFAMDIARLDCRRSGCSGFQSLQDHKPQKTKRINRDYICHHQVLNVGSCDDFCSSQDFKKSENQM